MQPFAKNEWKTWVPQTIEAFHSSTFEGSPVRDAPWYTRRKAVLSTFRFDDYVTSPELQSIEANNLFGRKAAEWVDSAPPEKKALRAEAVTRVSGGICIAVGCLAGYAIANAIGVAAGSLIATGVNYGLQGFIYNSMKVAAGCEKTPEELYLLGAALGGAERFNALPLYRGAGSIKEITKESVTHPVMRGMLLRFPEGKRKDRPRQVPFVVVRLNDKSRTTIVFRESLKHRKIVVKAVGEGHIPNALKVLEGISWVHFRNMVVPLMQEQQG